MSDIADFAHGLPGFYKKTQVDQLLILMWFCEVRQGRSFVDGALLRDRFREVSVEAPDMSVYLPRLAAKKPPQVVREKGGYRLSGMIRRDLDQRFESNPSTIAIAQTLSELPSKVPDLAERAFLSEALNCYQVKAYRAAIVMMWNLAYDHLLCWILSVDARLERFNAALLRKYPKLNLSIVSIEHFDELKESQVIEIIREARLLDKHTVQVLKDKLARRNTAAHPSRITFSQPQADDAIDDLVKNVILPLS